MMQKDNVVGASDLCTNIRKLLSCRRHVVAALFEIAPPSDMALLSFMIDTQFVFSSLHLSLPSSESLANKLSRFPNKQITD